MSELGNESSASLPPAKSPEAKVEVTSEGAKKMRVITDTVVAYKLVWLRVACYFIVPFVTTFNALTETWSGTTWEETHWFQILRLVASCFISGITSFVAYIDSSFQRAKQEAATMKVQREVDANEETAHLRRKDLQ